MGAMGFNRVKAKLRAKESMRSAYPHPMLVALAYLLATTVLMSVIRFFVSNPFLSIYEYLLEGYELNQVLTHFLTGGRAMIASFLSILLALYGAVMSFGYLSYGLRLARGEQPSYKNLLDGFSMVGRVLLTGLLIYAFLCLWSLLAVIPAVGVMAVLLAGGAGDGAYFAVSFVVIVMTAVVTAISYRYRMAYYFLLDHPDDITARQAITKSKQVMKGHKWELFVLDLSFLGWSLLVPFTLGILALWLMPYAGAAEANFYDTVTCEFAPPPLLEQPPDANEWQDPGANTPF